MIKPPFELRSEYLKNPIQIDTEIPRFSWIIEHEERNQFQSAYRIILSTEESLVLSETSDLWDSGKVESVRNHNISYKGEPLKSDSKYYWRVKWWDKNDSESKFSKSSSFETALLNETDWIANWISKNEFVDKKTRKSLQYKSSSHVLFGKVTELPALYLRKEFKIKNRVKSAKLYICGVGYYEARINGNKIGDRILEPAQTDYKKIALYSTYDITVFLQENNALGVILGNGRCVESFGYNFPKLIAQVRILYDDNTSDIIATNQDWQISDGPIIENGIYRGEVFDARIDISGWDSPNYDDSLWDSAIVVNGHSLSSQLMQPIKITKLMEPKKMFSPLPGMYIYDFEQNFTGYVRLKVQGPRDTQVQLRFAETLNKDGTLNSATNGNAPVTDIYILKGEGEEVYEPHFTYHGFRYVELTGFPGVPSLENIVGLFFHSCVPSTGDFFCSNELINKIHSNIIWGQLSNLMSIPTDCPQRDERHGWMGDAQLVTEEAMLNFDMARFYSKYLRDIKLCQKRNGRISDVVPPYWAIYPADPAWGSAYITIAWYMYWYYNDLKVLGEYYDSVKLYVDFLSNFANENISPLGKYGDWCPPMSIASKRTPLELVSTWYYYHDILLLSKIAKILGKNTDSNLYSKKADEIKDAFNKRFLKHSYEYIKTSFADRAISQTSNALPLYLNMVPENREKSIIDELINGIKGHFDYHIDTGIVGTRYIFDVLTTYGYPEIAYKMITQTSFPGYGYMIKEGATTLWERWEKLESSGMNSHNHIMLGSVDTWFYNTLAGIKCLEPGWKSIRIKPYISDDMDYACASLKTIKGLIYSAWEKESTNFKLTITIPVGCEAEVWIPIESEDALIREGDETILENKKSLNITGEIKFNNLNENYAVFNLGSGHYQFTTQNP